MLGGQLVTPAANTNPDTLTALGVTYQVEVNSSEAGYPFSIGYAVIKNERADGNRLVQKLSHIGFEDSYSRTRDNANVWTLWQRLDNFGCNTLAELKAALANV